MRTQQQRCTRKTRSATRPFLFNFTIHKKLVSYQTAANRMFKQNLQLLYKWCWFEFGIGILRNSNYLLYFCEYAILTINFLCMRQTVRVHTSALFRQQLCFQPKLLQLLRNVSGISSQNCWPFFWNCKIKYSLRWRQWSNDCFRLTASIFCEFISKNVYLAVWKFMKGFKIN